METKTLVAYSLLALSTAVSVFITLETLFILSGPDLWPTLRTHLEPRPTILIASMILQIVSLGALGILIFFRRK